MTRKLLAAWLALVCFHASAQTFPTKPVTLIVPYNAGGGTDAAARAIAKGLTQYWNKPVVVENISGADGLIGSRRVASAPADGHTVLLSVPNILLFKHSGPQPRFDAGELLKPISQIGEAPVALIASSKSGARTLAELVKRCQAPSSRCSWGSGEQFSLLVGQNLQDKLGIVGATNVPYRGTGPVVNDVLGGHLTFAFTSVVAPAPHHATGNLRILAIGSPKRSPKLPDVPTYAEAGIGNTPFAQSWFGLFAPKATPPEVVSAWVEALKAVRADRAVVEAIEGAGSAPVFSTPEVFAATLAEDERQLEGLLQRFPLAKP